MENEKDKMSLLLSDMLLGTEFKIVDVEFRKTNKYGMFRIYLDSERGITIGECHRIGKEINERIEKEAVFEFDHVLEVSSPGVERPFKEEWQFVKNIGRAVTVTYKTNENEIQDVTGNLERVSEGQVMVSIAGKKKKMREERLISMDKIVHGKVQLKW